MNKALPMVIGALMVISVTLGALVSLELFTKDGFVEREKARNGARKQKRER
jgi:hypothetical protein